MRGKKTGGTPILQNIRKRIRHTAPCAPGDGVVFSVRTGKKPSGVKVFLSVLFWLVIWEAAARALDSALLLCKTFLPRMAQAGSGRVLFLTGGVPAAQMASTAIVKSSLEGLARSLAAEYASSGVTVNCIAPGPLLTEETAGDPAAVRPEEVVPAMLFLLSEDAARINGVTLPIDGGTALR